jgi:hypothetical protein
VGNSPIVFTFKKHRGAVTLGLEKISSMPSKLKIIPYMPLENMDFLVAINIDFESLVCHCHEF